MTEREQRLQEAHDNWIAFGEYLMKDPNVPGIGKAHISKLLKASKEAMEEDD